jgi:hypothetical protein
VIPLIVRCFQRKTGESLTIQAALDLFASQSVTGKNCQAIAYPSKMHAHTRSRNNMVKER